MYSGDATTSLIVVGDQIFEVLTTNQMEQPYYTVNGYKNFSFIMSVDEDGDWFSHSIVDQQIINSLGAVIEVLNL
ncbi:MAG TPA: hypothetical protein PKM63_17645 [Panacibacter sp.]|nr:hypothetical protein [Panacibacter sp.]HNP46122.1 hypothetical protein [Panacibacter sp.]